MFNKDLLPKWNVYVGLSVEVGLKSGCGMVIVAQVAKSCPTLWDSMNCSMLGSSVLHCLPELAQTHVHWVSDAIQPSHPLSPPAPIALNASQHQCLFQWFSSLLQMAKICMKWSEAKIPQSCPTLCNPMDHTVHGILQARILERVAIPFSKGSSHRER